MKREHIERLETQGASIGELLIRPDFIAALTPYGFAGIVDQGIVACLGVVEQNPGNFRCWAHTDDILMSRYFLPACKAMRRWIGEFRVPRLETVVYVGNIRGHRWVQDILGFNYEGMMRNFHDGRDAWLYSRINR